VRDAGTNKLTTLITSAGNGTNALSRGFLDVIDGLSNLRLWATLGWREVIRRYRRTTLGPFWTTASLAVFVLAIGFMYSAVWGTKLSIFLPYLAGGYIAWLVIASTLGESCAAFTSAETLLRQLRLSYSGLVIAVIIRNLIVGAHHLSIFLIVWLLFPQPLGWQTLLIIPGLALWIVNGFWIGLVLSIASTRFRDIQQLVTSILQVAMFVTPIMYPVEVLLERKANVAFLIFANPFYHYVEIIRAPMLGQVASMTSYYFAGISALVGSAIAIAALGHVRNRIVFWL